MTLDGHFRELRIRVVISLVIITAAFLLILYYSEPLMNFLIHPISDKGYDLHFLKVHEAFASTVKASIIAALIATAPLWIWILMGFLIPALERPYVYLLIILIISSAILLVTGFYFSYRILLPLAIAFLLNFGADHFTGVLSLEYYLSFFLRLFLATGLGFQLPLIMLFLSRSGVLPAGAMRKFRKYAFIVILILSAIITPPDVISQIIFALPLYVLYELGIVLSLLAGRKKSNSAEDQNE